METGVFSSDVMSSLEYCFQILLFEADQKIPGLPMSCKILCLFTVAKSLKRIGSFLGTCRNFSQGSMDLMNFDDLKD